MFYICNGVFLDCGKDQSTASTTGKHARLPQLEIA